jgi:hypothetical protein
MVKEDEDTKREVAKKTETALGTATANFFQKYGQAAANRSHLGDILRFNKFGEYRFGKYDEEVPLGTVLAAYMTTLCTGWTLWQSNRPVEEIMGPVGEGFVPPPRSTLGYSDKTQWEVFDDGREKDPWAFTNKIVLVDLKGTEPVFYTFSTSSKGGIGALGALSLQYGERLRQKPGESPLIELGRDSYTHSNRSFGEIRVPVFKVVGSIPTAKLPPIPGFTEQPRLVDSSAPAKAF